jgi:hypothetical protein
MFLNARFREVRPDAFENLAFAPDCPPELASAVGVVLVSDLSA